MSTTSPGIIFSQRDSFIGPGTAPQTIKFEPWYILSRFSISWGGRNLLTSSKVLLRWTVSSKCFSAEGFPPATTRKTFLESPWDIGTLIIRPEPVDRAKFLRAEPAPP